MKDKERENLELELESLAGELEKRIADQTDRYRQRERQVKSEREAGRQRDRNKKLQLREIFIFKTYSQQPM